MSYRCLVKLGIGRAVIRESTKIVSKDLKYNRCQMNSRLSERSSTRKCIQTVDKKGQPKARGSNHCRVWGKSVYAVLPPDMERLFPCFNPWPSGHNGATLLLRQGSPSAYPQIVDVSGKKKANGIDRNNYDWSEHDSNGAQQMKR